MNVEAGDLLECLREHLVFRRDGEMITLHEGELLIAVENCPIVTGTALRVETSELVTIMLIEIPFDDVFVAPTYKKVFP